MKLNNLITLFFVLTGILGSIIGLSLYGYVTEKITEESIITHISTVSKLKSNEIYNQINSLEGRMIDFSSDGLIKKCIKEINLESDNSSFCTEKELEEHLKINKLPVVPELETVHVVGLNNKMISSSDKENNIKIDYIEKNFLKENRDKVSTKIYVDNDKRVIVVVAPIYENSFPDKKIIGHIVGEMDYTGLKRIIQEREGLGKNGEILIGMNGNNQSIFFFERLFEKDALDPKREEIAKPMKEALLGKNIILRDVKDYRGVDVIASTRYLPEYELGLVVKVDKNEAITSQVKNIIQSLIMISIITIFLSFFIGRILSNKISLPIKEITENVDEITKGNINLQLKNKSKIDEIKSLTNSLNRILASLKLAIIKTGMKSSELISKDEKNKK